MDARNRVQRQRVYTTYRDVFTGNKARVRQKKAIRRIVQQHPSACDSLLVDYGVQKVLRILKSLLEDHIFESEERASKEFPGLISRPSLLDDLRQHGKDIKVAIEGLREPDASRKKITDVEHERLVKSPKDQDQGVLHGVFVTQGGEGTDAWSNAQLLQLPFELQHIILSKLQLLLEESCFDSFKRWCPTILKERGWSCAAEVELTKWLFFFRGHARYLPDGCIDTKRRASLVHIIPVIAKLRHTAVHRLRLTSEEFLDQINSACTLAEILQDIDRATKIRVLHEKVKSQMKVTGHMVEEMQQDVDCIVQIRRQKELLMQKEQMLLANIAQRRSEIEVTAGQALVETINALLANDKSNTVARETVVSLDGDAMCTDCTVFLNEGDIESDEDRLRVELEW